MNLMKNIAILFCASLCAAQPFRGVDPFPRVITEQGVQEAIDLAAANGSKILHIVPLWKEFETAPGVFDYYNVDILTGHAKRLGLNVYLNFRVIDTNQSAVPAFYAQYSLDSSTLRNKLNSALTALANRVKASGATVRWLALGNEVDGYLTTSTRVNKYRTLFISGKSKFNQLFPGLPVTASMQSWANLTLLSPLTSKFDFYAWTYYPILANFTVTNPVDGIAVYTRIVQLSSLGKPVYWQEVGFPSATVCNSSHQAQMEFIYWATESIKLFPGNTLGATLYTVHDFPPEFVQQLGEYYSVTDPRFLGFLGSLGFIDQTGAPKTSWAVVQNWLTSW